MSGAMPSARAFGDRRMSRMVILPNALGRQIDDVLDAELAKHPAAAPDRELFRDQLINYFDEHGVIPEFSLEKCANGGAA
jgi:hypothetical protein